MITGFSADIAISDAENIATIFTDYFNRVARNISPFKGLKEYSMMLRLLLLPRKIYLWDW
jgi:hypothetical protein